MEVAVYLAGSNSVRSNHAKLAQNLGYNEPPYIHLLEVQTVPDSYSKPRQKEANALYRRPSSDLLRKLKPRKTESNAIYCWWASTTMPSMPRCVTFWKEKMVFSQSTIPPREKIPFRRRVILMRCENTRRYFWKIISNELKNIYFHCITRKHPLLLIYKRAIRKPPWYAIYDTGKAESWGVSTSKWPDSRLQGKKAFAVITEDEWISSGVWEQTGRHFREIIKPYSY